MRTIYNRYYTHTRASDAAHAATDSLFCACRSIGWQVNKKYVNEGKKTGYEVGVVYEYGVSPGPEERDTLLAQIKIILKEQGVRHDSVFWYQATDETTDKKYWRLHLVLNCK